jgi:hypothetical protein
VFFSALALLQARIGIARCPSQSSFELAGEMDMQLRQGVSAAILACVFNCVAFAAIAFAAAAAAGAASPPKITEQDGQHDFDFDIGVWQTHIKRVLDPLSGSTDSIELKGTVTVRKVWDGRAQLEEIEADGPNGHWEGLSLFLYNPEAHQWSQSFSNSKNGVLTSPMIGSFKNGRGELFAQDTFHNRTILVRAVWSDIKPDSHTYQESYSDDGGKTWALSFTANLTRSKP